MSSAARCARCGGTVVREIDELSCLNCGERVTPVRPWDAVEEPAPVRDRERFGRTGEKWSDAELEWLASNKDRMTAKEMGEVLGRSERAIHTLLWKRGESKRPVQRRRSKHSVTPRRNGPRARKRWGADELANLEDYVGPGSVRSMATRLGCTPGALRWQLARLGVRVREADGMLSLGEVMRAYGATARRVRRLVATGQLPAMRMAGTRMLRIDPDDADRVAPLLRARSKFANRKRRPPGGGPGSSAAA